jgi:hypothetical protein
MISITDGLRCYYNSNMKEKTPLELERENRILQSNWNSLREWLEKERLLEFIQYSAIYKRVLDKMNELEGGNKDEQ